MRLISCRLLAVDLFGLKRTIVVSIRGVELGTDDAGFKDEPGLVMGDVATPRSPFVHPSTALTWRKW